MSEANDLDYQQTLRQQRKDSDQPSWYPSPRKGKKRKTSPAKRIKKAKGR